METQAHLWPCGCLAATTRRQGRAPDYRTVEEHVNGRLWRTWERRADR